MLRTTNLQINKSTKNSLQAILINFINKKIHKTLYYNKLSLEVACSTSNPIHIIRKVIS